MEEKLKTTLLEYDKSTFIIDLVKHSSGQLYTAIEQIVRLDKNVNQSQKIKINPSILDDIIEMLTNFQTNLTNDDKPSASKRYFLTERKEEVKKRYFKGVSIKDLSVKFNCTEDIIEQILTNGGIEIVSNEIPKYLGHYRKRRKNKSDIKYFRQKNLKNLLTIWKLAFLTKKHERITRVLPIGTVIKTK